MATKKAAGAARYRVVRDVAVPAPVPGEQGRMAVAGEIVELDPDDAALLVRDGMLVAAEEV